jgi:hypothetical protein
VTLIRVLTRERFESKHLLKAIEEFALRQWETPVTSFCPIDQGEILILRQRPWRRPGQAQLLVYLHELDEDEQPRLRGYFRYRDCVGLVPSTLKVTDRAFCWQIARVLNSMGPFAIWCLAEGRVGLAEVPKGLRALNFNIDGQEGYLFPPNQSVGLLEEVWGW